MGKRRVQKAKEILENIVRLEELLDDETVRQLSDVPFLELAMAVSIRGPETQNHPDQRRVKRERKII